MPSPLNAKAVLGAEEFPTGDGIRLATYIIEHKIVVEDLVIDVRELAPEDLVSSFVNALFHRLEENGVLRATFSTIRWITKFDRERERLDILVSLYVEDTDAQDITPPPATPLPVPRSNRNARPS